MSSFAKQSLREFLDKVASPQADCGGGTTVLTAAAFGAGLISMARQVTAKKQGEACGEAVQQLEKLASELLECAELDGHSYDGVLQARRLPKDTSEEQQVRQQAVQKALAHAVEVPLQAAEKCCCGLRQAVAALPESTKVCYSDIAGGAFLLSAGLRGCLNNVYQNCHSLDDAEVFLQKAQRLRSENEKLMAEILQRVDGVLCI